MSAHSPDLGLEQSHDALAFVSEVAAIRLWHWRLPSGRLEIDAGTAAFCGLPPAVAGEDFLTRAIHADDRSAMRAALDRAVAWPASTAVTLRILGRDGAMQSVEARCKAHRDSGGRALEVMIATRDLTSRGSVKADLKRTVDERDLVERLSIATQAAGIYVWEFDWRTFKLTWDEKRLSGRSLNRHFGHELGNDFFKWVHPDDQHIGMVVMKARLAAGESDADFRYRLRLDDGSIRHIQAFARTQTDLDGNPLRSLGVSWDVTREVEATELLGRQADELRDAQRRLDRAALSLQEGHWEIDWRASKHWGSPAYYALLGYAPGEVEFDTYEKLEAIVHPDDLANAQEVTDSHLAQGTPMYEVELRIAVKGGGYRWFRLRGMAERDEQGQPIRMVGSIHDIQKQKAAEDALDEARARFNRAVQGTQDGLWEADVAAGRMWLSPRTHELLGHDVGELSDALDVLRVRIHPDELAESDAALHACLSQALSIDREMRFRLKNGEYRWFRVRATPGLSSDGKVRRMSGSIQDVTQAREARDALIQASAAAQAASTAKSAFLANMSHEIRTPMNGIIGMTSLLLDTTLDRSQRDYAETIRSSSESLLTIINDILDFSKIEAGRLDIECIEMDLHECVEAIGATLAFQAAAKDVELILDIHRDVPSHVRGDPQRIRQCLINLIGNAIKFTRVGEIAVEISVESREAKMARIRFAVRDTGIGIAGESVKTLFQPFVQADVSTTRTFGGTGLGLSIVRRLVELMGGEIGVESEVGQGSVFWFTLPLQPVAAATADAAAVTPTGKRLLIVDDNETNRHVIAAHLAHAGYDVTLASSGREALVTMRLGLRVSRPFDLVLTDFQMPDMDGATLGKTINADPLLARSRVVLLTSVDHHGDIERYASLGFAGFLTKPIRGRELRACISRILTREAHEWHVRSYPIVTAGSLAAGTAPKPFSGKVLLVEDNTVNQKVGQKFLERLGCEVRVAGNGAEAVKSWQQERFHLVLMDIQMPVMDGYTATRQIRDLEGAGRRTPIVALTADAMSGQLERCLQSGMDGLLTKPLNPERLQDTLQRFGLARDEDTLHETAVERFLTNPGAADILDTNALDELIGGDHDFGRGLCTDYQLSSRRILTTLRQLLQTADRAGIAAQAHQLKGASGNICSPAVAAACEAVESAAAQADMQEIARKIDFLVEQIERLNSRLATVLADGAPSVKSGG